MTSFAGSSVASGFKPVTTEFVTTGLPWSINHILKSSKIILRALIDKIEGDRAKRRSDEVKRIQVDCMIRVLMSLFSEVALEGLIYLERTTLEPGDILSLVHLTTGDKKWNS
ncbi:UNVERIFIED_CONTAM: hypothetical protein NCL1_53367 [Trichonephila clavipes]